MSTFFNNASLLLTLF